MRLLSGQMHGHLLFGELATEQGVLVRARTATDKVILLYAVPEQIEVLPLRLLLRLILLNHLQAFLLFKRLVTHIFEALPASVDHVHLPVLAIRLVRGDALVIRGVRTRTLTLRLHLVRAHGALQQRVHIVNSGRGCSRGIFT